MKLFICILSTAVLMMEFSAGAKTPGKKTKMRTVAAQGELYCSNSPAKKWGTYYCVSGTIANLQELRDVQFGTCEGSNDAGESEPVTTIEFKSLKHNSDLAATSSEWKDASAFDVSSAELGKGVMYIKQETLHGSADATVVRLKLASKEVRLSCAPVGKR